jgi:hypothetical protein
MTMKAFTAGNDVSLAYCIDDFTNPWRAVPTVLLLNRFPAG